MPFIDDASLELDVSVVIAKPTTMGNSILVMMWPKVADSEISMVHLCGINMTIICLN